PDEFGDVLLAEHVVRLREEVQEALEEGVDVVLDAAVDLEVGGLLELFQDGQKGVGQGVVAALQVQIGQVARQAQGEVGLLGWLQAVLRYQGLWAGPAAFRLPCRGFGGNAAGWPGYSQSRKRERRFCRRSRFRLWPGIVRWLNGSAVGRAVYRG